MTINQIIENLYIGDIHGAENLNELKRNGITHILQAMGGMQPVFPKQFTYKTYDILDTPQENISRYFDDAVRWIQNAIDNQGKVFVHCWAGVSRSSSFCIAYLMHRMNLNLDSATLLCRKARPIIYPNPGFSRQLQEYDRKLKQLRYQENQQARYKDDYTSVAQKLRQNSFEQNPAGLRSDIFQLNPGTKDRLGIHGLVTKGLSPKKEKEQQFQEVNVQNDIYKTKWLHQEQSKPHQYYSKSLSGYQSYQPIYNSRAFGQYGQQNVNADNLHSSISITGTVTSSPLRNRSNVYNSPQYSGKKDNYFNPYDRDIKYPGINDYQSQMKNVTRNLYSKYNQNRFQNAEDAVQDHQNLYQYQRGASKNNALGAFNF